MYHFGAGDALRAGKVAPPIWSSIGPYYIQHAMLAIIFFYWSS
jgi:hypothetical protein